MSNMIHPAGPDDDAPPAYNYDYDEEERPRGRLRRPLIIGVALAVVLGGAWYAYGPGAKRAPGDVPLIRADDTATKTRPNQPGGMAIPDQDKLVFDQGHGQPQVEKLLPAPETPLPRPAAAEPDTAPALPAGGSSPAPVAATDATPSQPAALAAIAPAAGPQGGVATTAMTATPAATPTPAPPPTTAAPAAKPAAAAAATPTPTPAKPPVKVALATTGGYKLQVGAMRSDEIAKKEWERIKAANKDILGGLNATWPRVDLGAKGVFYRIQTSAIADAATADHLCSELKQRNVGCIIVRQ
ncbi:MAG: SPOR domain-containing protein [Alphaproteobacteria bacterium]|nr:SPOR domain-containing protein [Alphaproteobacteria bacterium]